MSRYSIAAENPALEILVGWDNPMATFFAQVFNPALPERDECILWIGTEPEAITTVEGLQTQLCDYATIPEPIREALQEDYDHRTPPTALQRWSWRLR
jgi:hypothetical protein